MAQGLERLFWIVGSLLLLPFIIQQSLVLGHNGSKTQVPQLRSLPQASAAIPITPPVKQWSGQPGTAHSDRVEDLPFSSASSGRAALLSDTPVETASRMAALGELIHLVEKPIGALSIPSLGVEIPVFPDTSEVALTLGAGLISGTAQPNEATGYIGVASHRDGHFRHLKHLAVGDLLLLRTLRGVRHYQVTDTRIVDPGDTWVFDPTTVSSVTLVTCYPFQFVGRAPQRYIVSAQEVHSKLTAIRFSKPGIGGHHEPIKF